MHAIKPVPESIIDAYMCGKCMYLALAMHRAYGLTMVVELCEEIDPYIGHAWVLLDDDRAFDINGTNMVDAMGGYGDRLITLDNEKDIRELIGPISDEMLTHNIAEASRVIKEYFSP